MPAIIQGDNKAGKSLLCNELMDSKIVEVGKGKNKALKALCPINANPMTALPVMFRHNPGLDGHFLLGEMNIFADYATEMQSSKKLEANSDGFSEVEKKMI